MEKGELEKYVASLTAKRDALQDGAQPASSETRDV
jgi:hypothetical protein